MAPLPNDQDVFRSDPCFALFSWQISPMWNCPEFLTYPIDRDEGVVRLMVEATPRFTADAVLHAAEATPATLRQVRRAPPQVAQCWSAVRQWQRSQANLCRFAHR